MKVKNNNKIKLSFEDKIFNIVINILGVALMVIVLYPLIYVLSASFSDPDLEQKGEVFLLPKGITTRAYELVFENKDIWIGYKNTIIYTVLGTFINITLTILAAYPLSRKNMPFRKVFTLIIIFTMYFNGGLVPTYLLVKNLHLDNTIWAIVIPGAITTYNLLVAKTFFENSIPEEMYESAMLDGCSNFRMMINITIPLSGAIIAVLVLYYGVAHWNSYYSAMIYLRDPDLNPLQIVLRDILLVGNTEQMGSNSVGMEDKVKMAEAIKYSVIVVSSVPVLLLYPIVQKYFTKGVMIGAVKG